MCDCCNKTEKCCSKPKRIAYDLNNQIFNLKYSTFPCELTEIKVPLDQYSTSFPDTPRYLALAYGGRIFSKPNSEILSIRSKKCRVEVSISPIEPKNLFTVFQPPFAQTLTSVVQNPICKSLINPNQNVMLFIKAKDSEPFSGCFNNIVPVDLTTKTSVTVNVLYDIKNKSGSSPNVYGLPSPNFFLKFEGGPGGISWTQVQAVPVLGSWVQLTFDLTLPSTEGAPVIATGNVFSTITLIPDNGYVAVDNTPYHIGDIISNPGQVVVRNWA